MRIVIDTNALLSGLLWQGTPHTLLSHARSGTVALFASPDLLKIIKTAITNKSLKRQTAEGSVAHANG